MNPFLLSEQFRGMETFDMKYLFNTCTTQTVS